MHSTPNAGFVLWGRDGIQKHGLSAAEISSLSCSTIIMIPVGEGEDESCLGGSKSLSLAV